MEKYSYYINRFKAAIGILLAAFAIALILIVQTVPKISEMMQANKEIKDKIISIEDTKTKLTAYKEKQEISNYKKENTTIAFFRPIEEGSDAETIMSEEIGEILQTINDNKVRTRSIKYEYDSQEDNFIKSSPNKFTSCKLSMEMVSDYRTFERFIKDIYKHEHFLDISKIEISPYSKDKKILLISTELKLYAQKEGSKTPKINSSNPL